MPANIRVARAAYHLLPILCAPLFAQAPDTSFFETRIRPVLAQRCYSCHSSKLKTPMGGFTLDTKAGLLKGGATGAVLAPGKPGESRLLRALRYADPQLQMPPTGKLPDAVIADFETWIAAGAQDPRTESTPLPVGPKGMTIADGRKWWSFQPVAERPLPAVKDRSWPDTWTHSRIDAFVLAKLEENRLQPNPPADPRSLVKRVYVDLLGYKPTFEEVEAFANDSSPHAYEALIDRLMASPHYGERWARHWMDVARYAEDNSTAEVTNPPYAYAWRYRDWIIEAINRDVPYDRFVKLQLAADLMPGTERDDLRALGYLGTAPVYHKDQRLSEDVIGGFLADDWDERVDAVSRGLLAMTVACARCHDHKFDPILTKDYYGLAGVFASTMRVERPLFEVDPKVEARYLWVENRLFDLRYSVDTLTREASTVEDSASRVARWTAEIESLQTEMQGLATQYPKLVDNVRKYWTFASPGSAGRSKKRDPSSTEPFMNAVYDAAQYTDGTDPHFTFILYRPGEARDLPVFLHGNVSTPGDIVPRHFPTVLARGDGTFQHGSGRLDLAERIFSDAAPLAARVIVNRIWGWQFGKPLVATPSDFGVQGEKPTHPELLDDLAARFMAHGWSLKWLNREIMLSATYRQSSPPRADAQQADPANALLWRMNPRRLDIESYRDSLLRAAGLLSEQMYGPSDNLDTEGSVRRTVYGKISRRRLSNLLRLYDFPDPAQTSPGRDLTTSSLQQLFVMNSAFMHSEAETLEKSAAEIPDAAQKVRFLFRKILARDPSPQESDLASAYLNGGTLEQYAQVLLSTNEEIFWP